MLTTRRSKRRYLGAGSAKIVHEFLTSIHAGPSHFESQF